MAAPGDPCCARPLWAGEGLRRAAGDTLRPGGLALTEHGLALTQVPAGGRVLDAGCGLGATVRWLRGQGFAAVGLDASRAQLERGDRQGLPLVAAEAEALPFGPGLFQAALCECVLSLTPRPERVLAALGRVLVLGGMLIVSDLCLRPGPGRARAGARAAKDCSAGALDLDAFLAMVGRAGFAPRALEDHDRLLKELAARLILAGVGADAWRPGQDRAAGNGPKLGYFLLLAQNLGGSPCSTRPASGSCACAAKAGAAPRS